MNDETREPRAEVSVGLSGSALLEHLAIVTTERVDASIRAREEGRRRLIAFCLALAGIVGVGTLTGLLKVGVEAEVDDRVAAQREELLDELTDKTRAMVDAAVQTELGATERRLQDEVTFQQLGLMALSLDLREERSFTDAERDSAMLQLREVSRNDGITARTSFALVVEKVLDVFVAAGLREHVDEVDDAVRPTLTGHRGTSWSLAMEYGRRAVGGPNPGAALERFRVYAVAARKHKDPEVPALWELLIAFKQAGLRQTEAVDEHVRRCENLRREEDRESFRELLRVYSRSANWTIESTPESLEIERVVTALLEAYPRLREAAWSLEDGPGLELGAPALGH